MMDKASDEEIRIGAFLLFLEREFIVKECGDGEPVDGCMSCSAVAARAHLNNILAVMQGKEWRPIKVHEARPLHEQILGFRLW